MFQWFGTKKITAWLPWQRRQAPESIREDLPRNAFKLKNLSGRRISFWLGTSGGSWEIFLLEPGQSQVYRDRDRIWFATRGQSPAGGKLRFGESYSLVTETVYL